MTPFLITCVGLLAQGFFSLRTLVQWILSEKAHKVLSPVGFWAFSLCGAITLAVYGWLRQDFAVMAGQIISYYVYLWNLKVKGVRMARVCWALLVAMPLVAVALIIGNWHTFAGDFLRRSDIPLPLLIFGVFGQMLLTVRFIYQWWYSSRLGRSELPPLFWWLSASGAASVFVYGVFRLDVVLMLGQGFGVLVYARNIIIGLRQRR